MVGLAGGCAEEDVDGVADDLGNRSLVGEDDVRHARQVTVNQFAEKCGVQRLSQARETSDIGEERGDFAALACQV